MVEMLLAKDVDINITNFVGETPLHKAAAAGHRKMVEFLLQNDADLEIRDDYRRTALHKAIGAKHHVMRLLVNKDADVHAKDMYGKTALHLASESGIKDDVHFLMGHGASTDGRDGNGRTAQDLARIAGHDEVAELFNKMALVLADQQASSSPPSPPG
jgi:ankyrin repeat protein